METHDDFSESIWSAAGALNRILKSNCRWKPALFSGGAPETEGETLLLKQPTDKS